MIELLQDAFHGGPFKLAIMYSITGFLFGVIALALWRIYLLFMVYDSPNAKGMWAEIYKYVTNNRIEDAIRLCEKSPKREILPRLWKKGLQSSSRSSEETQNAIESASRERIPLCDRYINWFGTLANVTTLLGLLGTIAGLIGGFSAVADLTGAAKQTMLASEISHALYATAFGLGTALIAMIFHAILTTKANKVKEQADEFAAKLIELLQMRRNNLASKSSSKSKN